MMNKYNCYRIQHLIMITVKFPRIKFPRKNKWQVYQSEIQEDDFHNYEDNLLDSEPFDIDTPVETIQAYTTNYRHPPKRAGTDNRV
jgi:hypothetical protein